MYTNKLQKKLQLAPLTYTPKTQYLRATEKGQLTFCNVFRVQIKKFSCEKIEIIK